MNIMLFIKGLVVGFGKVIPGVSGAMLAIMMGIYDKGIKVISNFFGDIKGNLKFVVNVGLGIIIAIIFGSKIIVFSMDNFYLPTMLLFIGLIMGGIPNFMKSIEKSLSKKDYLYTIFSFIFVLMLLLINNENVVSITNFDLKVYFILFIIGVVDAATMIIPGISGTAILMLLGYYDIIMNTFSNFTNFSIINYNLNIIIPFGLGMIFGVIVLAKIIDYFLNNYQSKTYMCILGLALSSICLLFVKTFDNNYNFLEVVISLIMLVIGFNISKKIS